MGKPKAKQGGTPTEQDDDLGPRDKREEIPQHSEGLPQQQGDQILKAITDSCDALQQDIAHVAQGLGLLRAYHAKLADRVKQAEASLETLEPAKITLENQMMDVQRRLHTLERKEEDAEGRNRRNNIRIVGLPEGTECNDMMGYLETWLKTEVAPEGLSSFYMLERVHSVLARPLAPGRPPTLVVARLLHYKDRDHLLAAARATGPYNVGNGRVTLFPDYTLEVQRKRASFLAVKKALRDEGLQYSLMFPARLRVTLNEKTHFHDSPEEAWDWLELYKAGAGDVHQVENTLGEKPKPKRLKRTRRTHKMTQRPTTQQTAKERSETLQGVAILSQETSETMERRSDSDKGSAGTDTEFPDAGSTKLPHVTAGTADEQLDE